MCDLKILQNLHVCSASVPIVPFVPTMQGEQGATKGAKKCNLTPSPRSHFFIYGVPNFLEKKTGTRNYDPWIFEAPWPLYDVTQLRRCIFLGSKLNSHLLITPSSPNMLTLVMILLQDSIFFTYFSNFPNFTIFKLHSDSTSTQVQGTVSRVS